MQTETGTREQNNSIKVIGEKLNNATIPLKDRFRALFSLRNLGGRESIDYIFECFNDPSVLLQHELAYCLGQMQDNYSLPRLQEILENEDLDTIVRHESGEALGAIGSDKSLDVLRYYSSHFIQEIAETCQLAVSKINLLQSNNSLSINPYNSVDPAPPSDETDVQKLEIGLLNEDLHIFDRYRCMFALRNIGTSDCIDILAKGLLCKGSALFRHEIAYVLGQTQHPHAVPQLIDRLRDTTEHAMVRHESAEALGSIATDKCISILHEYLTDPERIVRESCLVALDISEYELSQQFQYAYLPS